MEKVGLKNGDRIYYQHFSSRDGDAVRLDNCEVYPGGGQLPYVWVDVKEIAWATDPTVVA